MYHAFVVMGLRYQRNKNSKCTFNVKGT